MMIIKKFEDFLLVREEWEKLWSKNTEKSIYQSVEYIDVLWKNFIPYRMLLRATPVFFTFYENDKIIMILPLLKKWCKREYTLFGYKSGCGYLDAIYGHGMNIKKMEECFKILIEQEDISSIYMPHVREKTILGQYIEKKGLKCRMSPATVIHLPDTYQEYLLGLSKHTRQNIRTSYNRMEKDGKKFQFIVEQTDKLSKKNRNELLDLYVTRQLKHYKRSGGILYKQFAKYIDIGTLAQKYLGEKEQTFCLTIDGKVAAYFDAFIEQGGLIIPRLAIVESFNRYSPGIVLLNEAIKYIFEKGNVSYIDLTHGDEKYKSVMGGAIENCVEGYLKADN